MPIASITKLMTVLIALEHLQPSDVVTVTGYAAQVGQSHHPLVSRASGISVHDLLAGALIQSANNAADALASAASRRRHPALRRPGERSAPRKLGLNDTHFVRPDGLDAPGHVSSARVVAPCTCAMHSPVVRSLVRQRWATIEGGSSSRTPGTTCSASFPGLIGVKTGHTDDAGLV